MIIGFKEASNVEIKASVLSALPLFNTPVSIADSFSQFEHTDTFLTRKSKAALLESDCFYNQWQQYYGQHLR
ncbi:hypothetical protein GLOIN_2v809760 [Rhizophagus irregularis DAOM 181602=DAOM 197198]|nr:hypothetical protein GLOIN_2v809760 [Rhizophagus irregularis DAOM 181602=DAOM 197198]